jgi:hypothetical protein
LNYAAFNLFHQKLLISSGFVCPRARSMVPGSQVEPHHRRKQ